MPFAGTNGGVENPSPPPPAPLTFDQLREVLDLSLRAGQLMLENGANTARVEDAVEQLGHALGASRMDVFVTPTGIIASDTSGVEHRTRLLRIYHSGIDLNRTGCVLELTRRAAAGELTPAQVREQLEQISRQPRLYGLGLTTLWIALACACFALLFGGGLPEVIATGVAAAGAHLLRAGMGRLNFGRITATYLVAVVASFAGLQLANLLGARTSEVALLSPVLLLVPGVLMVSSVSDLFRGDTVSGMARAMQAFLVTVTIGAGLWTTTLLSGVKVTPFGAPLAPLMLSVPLAFITTAGFAVLFDVPRKALTLSALVGAAAWTTRTVVLALNTPPEVAFFAGGMVCALLAEPLSRWLKLPPSTFIIPGFIPLVPGISAFHTVIDLASADYARGTAGIVRTSILIGALAAGIGVVNALRPTPKNAGR